MRGRPNSNSRPKRCVHPYADVQGYHSEPACCYDCDGGPTHYFTVCNRCSTVLNGEIPNPIPLWWDRDARERAEEITGYPIEVEEEGDSELSETSPLIKVLNEIYAQTILNAYLNQPLLERKLRR